MRDVLWCLAGVPCWGMPQQDAATLRLTAVMLGQALVPASYTTPRNTTSDLEQKGIDGPAGVRIDYGTATQ